MARRPRRFDQFGPADVLAALVGLAGAAAITLRWLAVHGDDALDLDFDPAHD